jgi:uncharacterized membrane protein
VDQIHALLIGLVVVIGILVIGGVFSEPISRFIRRRVPDFSYEGEVFLLWGALVIAAFSIGLIVMYLLLAR